MTGAERLVAIVELESRGVTLTPEQHLAILRALEPCTATWPPVTVDALLDWIIQQSGRSRAEVEACWDAGYAYCLDREHPGGWWTA